MGGRKGWKEFSSVCDREQQYRWLMKGEGEHGQQLGVGGQEGC